MRINIVLIIFIASAVWFILYGETRTEAVLAIINALYCADCLVLKRRLKAFQADKQS